MLHIGQVLAQIDMVLISDQAGAVAWLDVSSHHLHFLSCHLDGAGACLLAHSRLHCRRHSS